MGQIDRFRAALALDEDPIAAVDSLARDLAAQGSGGTVGFIYATDAFEGGLGTVTDMLREKTGVAHWIGTIGLGIMAGRQSAFGTPALAAMIATWPEGDIEVFADAAKAALPFNKSESGKSESCKSGLDKSEPGLAKAIIHVDPRNPSFDTLLQTLSETSGAYLIGGFTASRGRRFDQMADKPAEGGISGLFLGPEVDVAIGVAQGCVAIGPARTITAVEDNLITKIDGDTPLKALLDDLADTDDESLGRVLDSLHVGLPVAQSDTGDYIVRNVAAIDAEGGHIAIGERVAPGRKLFFCQRDRETATKDLASMVQKLKARAGTIHGALYVSCCGRGPSVFESADAELALVQDGLGDVPLIGFYANGEIAGDKVYGYTGVLALF
ncbi:MAG TPA: FIST C-terminal domain-containing protein [Methylovirgula sp.]|nr:FIST C-terminal domain-containing protein [Methylovirgula sp.]